MNSFCTLRFDSVIDSVIAVGLETAYYANYDPAMALLLMSNNVFNTVADLSSRKADHYTL